MRSAKNDAARKEWNQERKQANKNLKVQSVELNKLQNALSMV
jgi:hypothetical protein